MMTRPSVWAALILALLSLTCKEDVIIESSADSLVDPRLAPRVIFSYPALNSAGPYAEWDAAFRSSYPFEIRFNKLMVPTSVARALTLRSSMRTLAIDSNYVRPTGRETYRFVPFEEFNVVYYYKIGEVLTLGFSQPAADVTDNVIPAGDLGTFIPEPYFRVRYMSPPDGSILYPDGSNSLTLAFNSRINTSILPFVSIEPATPGTWKISLDSSSMSMQVAVSAPTQEYRVTVAAGAPDRDGSRSVRPFSARVSAIPFTARVNYSYDTLGARLDRELYVSTPYPLDTATIRPAFHIEPAIQGGLFFAFAYGSSWIGISPNTEFAPNTRYSLRIDTTLRAAGGFHLQKELTYAFHTGPFTVSGSYPYDQSTGVYRQSSINIYLTGRADTASMRSAFAIAPPVPGTFSASSSAASIYFSPTGLLARTTYTVTVGMSLRSVGGYAMPGPYTFSFTTGD